MDLNSFYFFSLIVVKDWREKIDKITHEIFREAKKDFLFF
jgi:hypothetical protein